MEMTSADVTGRIVNFLEGIGIPVAFDEIPGTTFLPGIEVSNGGLIVDRPKLLHPGDLLHEAGHLAVAPASLRPSLSGEVLVPGLAPEVLEFVTMLWSYAAALELAIDPAVVFHEGGYRGQSAMLLTNFSVGFFPTLHVLEDFGMAYGEARAAALGVAPFPQMVSWTR